MCNLSATQCMSDIIVGVSNTSPDAFQYPNWASEACPCSIRVVQTSYEEWIKEVTKILTENILVFYLFAGRSLLNPLVLISY